MAYLTLTQPSNESAGDRLKNLETRQTAGDTANVLGTHYYPPCGAPAAQTSGTDTAGVANKIWMTEVRIERNTLLTGLSYLIGATGTTDSVIVLLFDSNGVLLANSAVAGVTVGSPAVWQRVPFTAAYSCAPGMYFAGVQTNGTHATIRTQAGGDHNTGVDTTQTFGTPVATTVPATFTANVGPYVMTY